MQPGKLLLCGSLMLFLCSGANAQGLLRKLKQKAESVADKIVDKKIDEQIGTAGNGSPGSTGGSRGGKNNSTGEGLVTVPPDVNRFLNESEEAYKKKSLSDSRYSLQQAMLGVEMEIGKKILKDLPPMVKELKKDTSAGRVSSSGWGWVGLMIEAEYKHEKKELGIIIANNAVWMQAINLYLSNGAYSQSDSEKQNWKQTKYKGIRSVIEFEKSSGYKLSVPLGQNSLIVFNGVNFATEAEMMDACNVIDIDAIKKELGEK